MSQDFLEFCTLCFSDEQLEEHHTSYIEDETVLLCRSCHRKVHRTPGFHDDLQPSMTRNEARRRELLEGEGTGTTRSVYIKDDDVVEQIEAMVENPHYSNYSHFFTLAAIREIKAVDEDWEV